MSLVDSAPPPLSPSTLDISRPKLKQLARWIRDDLDILVAREGPDVLRPDDLLTLHDLFLTLRRSTTITALDLCATGIHKAVKDIAGIATRWPRRLCDDCDTIITIWQSRFGPLEELHPFLYGRCGRLKGLASASEYGREALLKRWSQHCPERIDPSVSHRQGSLGFKAGDWWLNTLFAHHAGIIGLDSVEGGTTCDKDGAYALVLKNTGEISARSEEIFTYRFHTNDKGKFRLTAATPKSRDPMRVLLTHSTNSIWGPKAGVRYEGLYSVNSWCVRQARPQDTASGKWKEGDILYEVTLHRKDPVPLEEVICRPTNTEIDDYVEYKRLRKVHRKHKHKDPRHAVMPQQVLRTAPPISPFQPPASLTRAPQSLLRISPSASRQTMLKEPAFNVLEAPQEADRLLITDPVSPTTVADLQESSSALKDSGSLAMPALENKSKPELANSSDKPRKESTPISLSVWSSANSGHSDLKDILPWIDAESELPAPPSLNPSPRVNVQMHSQAGLEVKAAELNPVKNVRRPARDPRQASDLSLVSQNATDKPALSMLGIKRVKETEKRKNAKQPTFGKTKRFFHGMEFSADKKDGDYHADSTRSRRLRSSSVDGLPQRRSSTQTKPVRPNSLFDYGIEDIEFTSPLEELILRTDSPMLTYPGDSGVTGERIVLGKLRRWLSR